MLLNINQKTQKVNFSSSETAAINGVEGTFSIIENDKSSFHLLLNNKSYRIGVIDRNGDKGEIILLVNDIEITVKTEDKVEEVLEKMGINRGASLQIKDLKAPMPGLVLRLEVSSGDYIKKGDPLLVLEAMKMENVIKSPTDGQVESVHISISDKVEKNQILIKFS